MYNPKSNNSVIYNEIVIRKEMRLWRKAIYSNMNQNIKQKGQKLKIYIRRENEYG